MLTLLLPTAATATPTLDGWAPDGPRSMSLPQPEPQPQPEPDPPAPEPEHPGPVIPEPPLPPVFHDPDPEPETPDPLPEPEQPDPTEPPEPELPPLPDPGCPSEAMTDEEFALIHYPMDALEALFIVGSVGRDVDYAAPGEIIRDFPYCGSLPGVPGARLRFERGPGGWIVTDKELL